jgi:hypothetical protein
MVALLLSSSCAPQANDGRSVTRAAAALDSCDGTWTLVDSPNVGGQDNALASVSGAAPDDVWAVGQVAPDANPNITLTLALHFDGTAWSVVDTPNIGKHANALLAVTAQPGAAWAVGYHIDTDFLADSLIEAWDGTSWKIAHHPHPFDTENLYGAASTSASDVWAVGSGRDGEGAFHTLALHFDGKKWSVVPTVDPGVNGNVLYGVVAVAPDDVWAVGQKIGDAPPDQSLIEHWDGSSWSEVPGAANPAASTQLLAVAAAAGGDIRGVGDAQDGIVSLRTFAEISEGRRFEVQGAANPSDGDNRLTGVTAPGDDETWAVGNFLDVDSGNQQTLIVTGGEGGTWLQVPTPNPSADGENQLSSIAQVGRHDLWAVGAFDGADAGQTLTLHRCR